MEGIARIKKARKQIKTRLSRTVEPAKFRRRAMAISVMFMSSAIMYAWYMQWYFATRISAEWVTMKFISAFTFFLCALCILMEHHQRRAWMKGVVGATALYTFASYGSPISFVPNFEDPVIFSIAPNYPSMLTILGFLMFGLVGFWPWIRKFSGYVIVIMSVVVMTGYVIGWPLLFGYVEGYSTAMAAHTAFLFLHLGFYLVDAPNTHEP